MSINSIAETKNHRPKSPEEAALMVSTQILKTLDAAVHGMLLGAFIAGFFVVGVFLLKDRHRKNTDWGKSTSREFLTGKAAGGICQNLNRG